MPPDNNVVMEISGRVENGVVVLPSGVSLPEGAVVMVMYPATHISTGTVQQRVTLPIFNFEGPPDIHLTNQRIHEILEEEDIEALKRSWNAASPLPPGEVR